MVLISVNVFDACCKKTLLTRTVLETHDDTLTISTVSDICIYCAIAVPRWNYDKEQFYPQCADCSAKPAIENDHFKKRKKT